MNGLLLVPTLNRIDLLKRFLHSYKEAESTVTTALLVDAADYKVNQSGYQEILDKLPPQVTIVNTHEAITMGDKCRFIYPKMRSLVPDLKWVGLLNDDHYIVTKKWDEIAEKLIDGKNFISTNDGFWMAGVRCCGLTAWSLPLLEKVGFPIYPEKLQHLYIDDLWKAIGDSSGCYLETMKINIEHRHVLKGDMQPDSTYFASNEQSRYIKEQPIFKRFMEERFKDVCLGIVKWRSEQVLDGKFV